MVQSLWILFMVVMLFWKFRIGVAACLAYMFLVPYMKIDIGGFTLQWNIIYIILLIAFFFHRQQDYDEGFNYDWRPFLPFVIYFAVSLILIPVQDGVPFGEAIRFWRANLFQYLILPFVIWNDIRISQESLKLYRNVTIVCILIAAVYGLYLTTMPGINPYMIALSAANGEEFNLAYAAGNSGASDNTTINEDRLFGRISSVFNHPMTFGLFLGFAIFYLYRNKDQMQKWIVYGMLLFILADIIACGVRSVIVASFIAILVTLIQSRSYKLLAVTAIAGGIVWSLVTYIPTLNAYLGSIFDQASSNVAGSSMNMRTSQFEGCLQEIKNCSLEGKGYSWTEYYTNNFGRHPTILNFESLVFVILCDSGIIGIILWLAMGYTIVKYNNWSERPVAAMLNSLFVFYIAFACITGEYHYMKFFIIFYILMLGEDLYMEDVEVAEAEIEAEEEVLY